MYEVNVRRPDHLDADLRPGGGGPCARTEAGQGAKSAHDLLLGDEPLVVRNSGNKKRYRAYRDKVDLVKQTVYRAVRLV